jgi:shikimate dehydrogenase
VAGKKILVLGSGGASNTVVAVLQEQGANPVVISRSGQNHYGNLYLHRDAAGIVNATPVGMYPDTLVSPVDLDLFPHLEAVLDVIYNPAKTKLLLDAQAKGIPTENGLWMLVAQAKESSEWFTGKKISDALLAETYEKIRRRMENIILIGMPGCGKTTIATHIAKALNRKMIDLDAEVIQMAGCSIPEIFAKHGEQTFRSLETAVLSKYGKESGLVIATGGGSVTRAENYAHIHQNGTAFWLTRELSKLPTEGRPLSQSGKLESMYAIRKPLYDAFSDYIVSNDGTIENTVSEILSYYTL